MGKHERDERPSRLDKRHKKPKRHHDDDKKKRHKKHKDRKSHRRHKRSRGSDSDSNSDGPAPDYDVGLETLDYPFLSANADNYFIAAAQRAMKLVRELLTETPELAKDLLGLLQMVDDGQVAVIGGIENKRIKSKLKELFPLLGLVKLREPKGAFAKPKKEKVEDGDSLMQIFQRMLTGSSDDRVASKHTIQAKHEEMTGVRRSDGGEEKPGLPKTSKRGMPIGPALPPSSTKIPTADNSVDDDDDDEEVVGPALPGMRGFRLADERVEAEMARRAELLEKEQWERARDVGNTNKTDSAGVAPLAREAWMTMMPESSILKDSLGPQNRPPPGKPVAFRSKEPAAVDKTWFDSPEERERAKRAKLDMELLGYVREENKPVATAASSVPATTAQPSVNESILPNANPEADEEMRKQMENLRKARGPSLLEQHQRKQAEEAKHGATSTQSSGGWNRDRDLSARRGMSGDDAERMITAAKQINSKFTAPTISRQFL